MITVLGLPPLVSLTGNPIRFQLQTDNHLEVVGEKVVFTMEFSNGGTGFENDWIELKWGGKVVRLVCKPSPDGSGNQVHDNSVYSELIEWVEKLGCSVAANYYISNDFHASSDGPILRLEAKELGDQFQIDCSWSWTSADKPLAGISGQNQTLRPFFKIGLQVLLGSGDSWILIGEDIQPVSVAGITTFDIHSLFSDHVISTFQYPEATSPLIKVWPSACKEYRVRYFEQYGGDISAQGITESESFYILHGGLSSVLESFFCGKRTSFWEKLTYNNFFLTWQPKEKWITRDQTEKLFFLVQTEVALLVLRIAFFFKDGTGNHSYPMGSIENPVPKKVYEITCTPSVMQVPGFETDLLDYFQVWLENGEMDRISEVRTYRMDYRYYENVRLFLFQNSLGGYDTLRITGDQEDFLEYDRLMVETVAGFQYTDQTHSLSNYSITENQVYKANSGWISPSASAWIRDFFLSRQIFQIIHSRLVPIVVTSTQIRHRKDHEELFSIDFEYRRSWSSEHYSKEAVGADFNLDFNFDYSLNLS